MLKRLLALLLALLCLPVAALAEDETRVAEAVMPEAAEMEELPVPEDYLRRSIPQFLLDSGHENRVYAPLNVYLALGMLAEAADGDTRGQLLALLGAEDLETVRAEAAAILNANTREDKQMVRSFAASLWLDESIPYRQDTLEAIARNYFASVYQGEAGSDTLTAALRSWLNEHTGGLLEAQANGIELPPDTLLALATTVYFRGRWDWEFSPEATSPETFHAPDGDTTCDFMHSSGSDTVWFGKGFAASRREFQGWDSNMWFILPDEGVSVDDLLESGAVLDFLIGAGEGVTSKYAVVNLAVPKFDVVSDADLCSGLQALGVTDAFDAARADFSALTEAEIPAFVSRVQHAARVQIDEEGAVATAYTVVILGEGAAAPPEEEIDFVLDRPFLFVITDAQGLPMFVGVVNQP